MKYFMIAALIAMFVGCEKKQTKETSSENTVQYKDNVSTLLSVEKNNVEQAAPNFFWFDKDGKQISFVEFSNLFQNRKAFKNVSCSRSFASSLLPIMRRA